MKLLPSFLKRLSIGASIKMVHGFWYGAIENFGSSVETLNNNDLRIVNDASFKISSSPDFGITYDFESDTLKNSSFSPFPTPAGTGFGFDLGFTAELNDILTMGLAVTDIGSITWDQETVEYSSGSEFLLTDLTDSEMMDSLTNSLQGEGHYAEEFSTSLPTAIRFGVSMQVDRIFQGFSSR